MNLPVLGLVTICFRLHPMLIKPLA